MLVRVERLPVCQFWIALGPVRRTRARDLAAEAASLLMVRALDGRARGRCLRRHTPSAEGGVRLAAVGPSEEGSDTWLKRGLPKPGAP
jgi:hypothetical protein